MAHAAHVGKLHVEVEIGGYITAQVAYFEHDAKLSRLRPIEVCNTIHAQVTCEIFSIYKIPLSQAAVFDDIHPILVATMKTWCL